MRIAIAIGMLGVALFSNGAAAQTAGEQTQILRDFEQSVDDYARHQCLTMFPEAITAAAPLRGSSRCRSRWSSVN